MPGGCGEVWPSLHPRLKVAVAAAQGSIGKALADLDGGALSEMEALIESARNVLAPV